MTLPPLRIGTRGSALARWQADHVASQLRALGAHAVECVEIQTTGDRLTDRPLAQAGGDGLFTREIQRALRSGDVDIAVHSLKDLPTAVEPGLILAAVPSRGPAADVLVSPHASFDALAAGSMVGTGSLRRRAQLLHRRPDIDVRDVRGNVETRLRKLTDGQFTALVLAQAGLERLGLQAHIAEVLSIEWMLPAVGQGALALECRAEDAPTRALVSTLDHRATRLAVSAERALLATLGGGCLLPVGVVSSVDGDTLHLRAAVLSPDGRRRVEAQAAGPAIDSEPIGRRLADELLARGAGPLLAEAGAEAR